MEITIKGSFLSFPTRGVMLTFGNLLLLLIILYKVIFPDMPVDSEKYYNFILTTIGLFCSSLFFYWLLTTDYYYYELYTHKIIVRNLLKPYKRELPFSTLQYVNLWGNLTTSKWRRNSLEFIYQYNDSRKNFQYFSINYNQGDWIHLIQELKKLNIELRDPGKRFFKYTDITLDKV
jgi:hypothetical protein